LAVSRLAIVVAIVGWLAVPAAAQRWDGFNVIAVPEHPYGSDSAARALAAAKRAGAVAVAVIPFLWQRDPHHAGIVRGVDMSDDALRQAIRQARALGLRVMVKPHIWVDGSWAGAVEPQSAEDWSAWFERYRAVLLPIARIAAEEGAAALSVGTEIKKTTQRAEWRRIIADVRELFPGQLTYAAHNMDEAEAVPFWDLLDLIAVTLYPPLGEDRDRDGRRAAMQASAARLDALSKKQGKPAVVAEIGLRSAEGATRKPWESAEERAAPSDPALQAAVLADWLDVLDRPSVAGVLLWRWFTDPRAGGPADTDFTVQGKPAERLLCERAKSCGE
jgi:hypothetical protein